MASPDTACTFTLNPPAVLRCVAVFFWSLQVMQLTWTGQTQLMASVAANPPPLLAGALADSLLLVRPNSSTGEPEVRQQYRGPHEALALCLCWVRVFAVSCLALHLHDMRPSAG
jgi:hypothetical protein